MQKALKSSRVSPSARSNLKPQSPEILVSVAQGHVREDGAGRSERAERGGTTPPGRDQAAVHGLAGDNIQHGDPRLPGRGHKARPGRLVQGLQDDTDQRAGR
jgi:hypothetical protein